MLPPQQIWTDPTELVAYYRTHPIPLDPQPGVLVASIVVSILGSYATLLLLGRRSSSRGWHNNALLALAALCFAAVAVWGMHFVSMISIRLDASPSVTWYLQFSRGMTALSLFVPLVATFMAFWLIGAGAVFQIWRVVAAGPFLGLTIGLMHYSASFQLPYLRVSYTAVTVIFALVLACVAATLALFAFFQFRAQWQNSFWKRSLCSLFLAAAVCGMHYLGLGGTSYMTKDVDPEALANGGGQSTRLTISISVMCAVIIIISIGLAVVDILTRRNMREKARHIVVAEAIFDDFGKILVKHDGTIPMQIIETNADLGRVLSEIDPRQRTFHWLYQLTFNWHLVQPLVPRIVKAMRVIVKEEDDNFRGRFIEASVGLAQQLNLSVGDLGVLFDRVMTTGTRRVMADDESVHGISLKIEPSEGVLLFLCREIGGGRPSCVDYPEKPQDTPANFDTVEWWLERGYRLTDTRFFARTLADHMGTGRGEMDIFLSACKTYAKRGDRPVVQTQGTYLALFGVRPAPQSLDVMVYNFARHQIPAYRLPEMHYPISPSMRAWVRECGNMTMGELQITANDAVHRAETSTTGSGSIQSQDDEQLYEFQAAIGVAIHSLITALKPWPQLLDLAKLSSEILELPSSNHDDEPPAQMIVLQCILPAPEARLTPVQSRASGVQAPFLNTGRADGDKPPQPFVYTPWSLFTKSQTCLMRGKAWTEMCRSMNAELVRLYPPYDLAAEVIEQEKGDGWATRASKLGLKADTHRRMASGETTWTSEDLGEAEKGFASQEMLTATPDTYANITPGKKRPSQLEVKKGISAMISQVTSTVAPGAADAEVQLKKRIPGAPIYQNIRLKADQWQARCIRDLEREDVLNMLDGYDWVTAARCG